MIKLQRGVYENSRLGTIEALAQACGVLPAWLAFGVAPARRKSRRR